MSGKDRHNISIKRKLNMNCVLQAVKPDLKKLLSCNDRISYLIQNGNCLPAWLLKISRIKDLKIRRAIVPSGTMDTVSIQWVEAAILQIMPAAIYPYYQGCADPIKMDWLLSRIVWSAVSTLPSPFTSSERYPTVNKFARFSIKVKSLRSILPSWFASPP